MARKKIKVGDKVKYDFIISKGIGELLGIETVAYGTVSNTWYRIKGEDGTIYPCRKENLTIVND
jgi:hypothetical protein|tara:strand:+ start:73 stop:264 length:192 start_codon:yes stop_codon:yes gene_type:complete